MAQLSTKIKLYLDREVTFVNDVVIRDDRIDGISNPYIAEWNVAEAQPTDEQLNALESEATTLESNVQVIQTRKELYGTAKEQLEYIVENGVSAFIEKQQQIKISNPKE